MRTRLEGVAELVAVTEAGGFSAAARRLGASKSLLSARITRLEARLGVRLLHRTTRKLSLTEAGQVYYEHGRRILEEASVAEDALQELRNVPRGRLHVATTVQFASEHLAPALPSFYARYPDLTIDLLPEDGFTDLTDRRVDLAIRMARIDNPSVIGRRLAPVRHLLCAAPSYLERRGRPEHPAELHDHACLTYGNEPTRSEWKFCRPGHDEIRVRVAGTVRTGGGIVLRAAAVAGIGIAQLTTINAGDELRAGRLVEVLRGWRMTGLDDRAVWAVYPCNRALPPKVRVFVDFLAAHIGTPPYWDRGL